MSVGLVFTNARVIVNGTDLSSGVRKVTLNLTSETVDNTTMGATTRSRLAGLKDGTVEFENNQDFTASGVDATIFPILNTTSCFEIRPVNACSTASNPTYSGVFLCNKYTPFAQSVGQLALAVWGGPISGTVSRASSS